MKISIGIDIGKRKCDYCIVDGRGNILERGQYKNTPDDIASIVKTISAKYKKRGNKCSVACETTANMWLMTYDAFEKAGFEIKLANTFKMAGVVKTAKKTDKIDAHKIAEAVRMGVIPECYVPSAHIRGVRSLAKHRVRLVRERTGVINYTRSILDKYAIDIPGSLYTEKALQHLESIKLGSAQDGIILRQCAKNIRYFGDEIKSIEKELEHEVAVNEDAKLLMSFTGIGPYSAILLAAEIGNIKRFETPKQMISWAGLCPTIHQSGDKTYMGKIKKIDTDDLVTWTLCQCANVAAMHDSRMKKVYESAKRRHGGKHVLAIVVVAHKMMHIAWHMLTTKTPYSSRNETLYETQLEQLEASK